MNKIKKDILQNNIQLSKKVKKILADTLKDSNKLVFDKSCFFNPLIYTYFSYFKESESISIEPYLIGFKKQDNFDALTVKTNKNGIVYLSNIGYLTTPYINTEIKVNSKNAIFSVYQKDSKEALKIEVKPIYKIPNSNIEILLHSNSIIELIGNTGKKKITLRSESDIKKLTPFAEEALELIKRTNLACFEEITQNLRMIIFFDASYNYNFSALEYNGAVFFNPSKSEKTVIWFVDSLIHEATHINLNLALINFEEYFTIDPYQTVFSSPFRKKDFKRGLIHVVHALYVIAKLCLFYDQLISKLDCKNKYYNEVLGRLVLNIRFLETGFQEIDYEPFYTKKGLLLLNYFKDTSFEMSKKRKEILQKYKVPANSNNHLFSLTDFEKINQLNNS